MASRSQCGGHGASAVPAPPVAPRKPETTRPAREKHRTPCEGERGSPREEARSSALRSPVSVARCTPKSSLTHRLRVARQTGNAYRNESRSHLCLRQTSQCTSQRCCTRKRRQNRPAALFRRGGTAGRAVATVARLPTRAASIANIGRPYRSKQGRSQSRYRRGPRSSNALGREKRRIPRTGAPEQSGRNRRTAAADPNDKVFPRPARIDPLPHRAWKSSSPLPVRQPPAGRRVRHEIVAVLEARRQHRVLPPLRQGKLEAPLRASDETRDAHAVHSRWVALARGRAHRLLPGRVKRNLVVRMGL